LNLESRTIEEGEDFLNFYVRVFIAIATIGLFGGILVIGAYNFTRKKRDLSKISPQNLVINKDEKTDPIFLVTVKPSKVFNFTTIILTGLTFVGAMVTQIVAGLTQSITSVEEFQFYVFAAISEEYFYRFFISTLIYLMVERILDTLDKKNDLITMGVTVFISIIISTIFTSYFFYTSHIARYGDEPNILWGIFFLSIIFTFVYTYSKNLIVPIIVHLLVNFLAYTFTYGLPAVT
jgi:membrane protease YdiL (CAAX protease family)